MTISELTLRSSDPAPVRRFEVFTGSGRRRDWPPEEKARIVAESYEAGATVSGVARRYALSPQQLFTWRRQARRRAVVREDAAPVFVPAVIAPPTPTPAPAARRPAGQRRRNDAPDAGVIELEVAGIVMRVGRGADAKTVAAVIRALKATS